MSESSDNMSESSNSRDKSGFKLYELNDADFDVHSDHEKRSIKHTTIKK